MTPAFWRFVGGALRFGTGFLFVGLALSAVLAGIGWVIDGIAGRKLDYKAFFNAHDLAAICGNSSNTGGCPYLDNGAIAIFVALAAFAIVMRWLVKRFDTRV